jgi:uncharacterized protein (UPF0335 family)
MSHESDEHAAHDTAEQMAERAERMEERLEELDEHVQDAGKKAQVTREQADEPD